MTAPTLADLGAAWLRHKAAETAAEKARVDVEEQIVTLTGVKDAGSQTHEASFYKVVVTGKQTLKMDMAKWEAIKAQVPKELHPIKTKTEVDAAGVKWLRENRSDLYALLPIEIKPAKTSVVVTLTAEGMAK